MMRCKKILVLLVILIFVVSCAPQEISDEELEKELEKLSDQELKGIVEAGENSNEDTAIAGQAFSMFKASKPRVLKKAIQITERRKIEKINLEAPSESVPEMPLNPPPKFETEVPFNPPEISYPPVLDPIGDKQVKEGELLAFIINATDKNLNDTLTYSAQGMPFGASFDAKLQTFNWIPAYNQDGIYPITFKVSDGKDEDNETINITVLNSTVLDFCVPKPNGLVSWWDGDKVNGTTAYDLVGGHHGTLANGAKIGTGMVGNAFNFSGNNGYVGVAHNADFNIDYSWFIDAWVLPTSFPASGKRGVILMKWVDGGENKALEIGSDGKVFVTLVKVPSTNVQLIATTNLTKDRFTFVAVSYNGTALNLYLNGKLDNSIPLFMDVSDSTGVLYMGNHPTRNPSEFVPFDGLIDEVEWGTEAPTEQKIMDIFSSTSKGKCK
ncbi:MAG: hypothetical protein KKA62_02720 [Nanoarchaeota archaeon]|nr:hypothetical protein [Nanoarchaeota archaeon]MBU1644551.1 hypothetical protein [Nanoarchaeota archaeon]MBU1976844.1 hypothetical protein [Nanoarchaeota archaeon]